MSKKLSNSMARNPRQSAGKTCKAIPRGAKSLMTHPNTAMYCGAGATRKCAPGVTGVFGAHSSGYGSRTS